MTFKEYYQLPLKTNDGLYAFTSNDVMAFNRMDDFSEQDFRDVIDILNGKMATRFDNVEYDCLEQQVLIEGQVALDIRGWGGLLYLVGKNEAIAIQDDFGEWIADKLGNYEEWRKTVDYWGEDALNAPLREELIEEVKKKLFKPCKTSEGNDGLVVGLEINLQIPYLIVLDITDEQIEYMDL